MKHFPSAAHSETREAALPRRRRLGTSVAKGGGFCLSCWPLIAARTQVDLKVLKSTCPRYQKMMQSQNGDVQAES